MKREMHVYVLTDHSKISREELKFAAKFMLSLMISKRMHNAITLRIENKEIAHEEQTPAGYVWVVGNSPIKNPREFFIRLDSSMSKRALLLALAHELVHVKQFARNQLGDFYTYDDVNYATWKKR